MNQSMGSVPFNRLEIWSVGRQPGCSPSAEPACSPALLAWRSQKWGRGANSSQKRGRGTRKPLDPCHSSTFGNTRERVPKSEAVVWVEGPARATAPLSGTFRATASLSGALPRSSRLCIPSLRPAAACPAAVVDRIYGYQQASSPTLLATQLRS